MLVSTRGRYAVRVIVELCSHGKGALVPLKIIAENQEISLKYLESIISSLVKKRLVEGVRGTNGGYRLTRAPDEYTVGEILEFTEGTFAPVSCLVKGAAPCARAAACKTLPMWEKLDTLISNYLYSVRVSDLLDTSKTGDYII